MESTKKTNPQTNGTARDSRSSEEEIYKFWDGLADFAPSDMPNALLYCMQRGCEFADAQNALWVGLIRIGTGDQAALDPLSGWRVGAIEVLHPTNTDPGRFAAGLKLQAKIQQPATNLAVVAGAGRHRIYSLGTGIVDLDTFKHTEHYDLFYRQQGIKDRIWSVSPVNDFTESLFLFDRYEVGRFTPDALGLVAHAMRGIRLFHKQLLASHGLGISETPLTPAEKRLLLELLTGASEKEIAERLSLTVATTHQYAVRLYRKFGLHGRTEFMALWMHTRL